MDLYETKNSTNEEIKEDYNQIPHEDKDSENMSSSTEETNSGHPFINPENHIPNLLDSDEQFGEHSDIPYEENHPVQNGASPKEEDFDFEKKLPDIPHGNERNESETQMKFSATHFQDDEPLVDEDNFHPQQPEIKEEYSHADVEEDDDEVAEPAQEVNHMKPQEKSPEASPVKQEEISTPSPSHRPPSPVLMEEPKHEECFKSTESPAATAEKSIPISPSSQPEIRSRQPEPTQVLAEAPKTRSVKSTKSDGVGRNFLGKYLNPLIHS